MNTRNTYLYIFILDHEYFDAFNYLSAILHKRYMAGLKTLFCKSNTLPLPLLLEKVIVTLYS